MPYISQINSKKNVSASNNKENLSLIYRLITAETSVQIKGKLANWYQPTKISVDFILWWKVAPLQLPFDLI